MVSDLLESGECSAMINSYEHLPTRNSPRTLISSFQDIDQKKYEDRKEYPFETIDTLKNKWTDEKKAKK